MVEIDIEVSVREPVSRSRDGAPGHLGVALSFVVRDVLCCLADDLDEPCERERQLQVSIEVAAPAVLNEGDCLAGRVSMCCSRTRSSRSDILVLGFADDPVAEVLAE